MINVKLCMFYSPSKKDNLVLCNFRNTETKQCRDVCFLFQQERDLKHFSKVITDQVESFFNGRNLVFTLPEFVKVQKGFYVATMHSTNL